MSKLNRDEIDYALEEAAELKKELAADAAHVKEPEVIPLTPEQERLEASHLADLELERLRQEEEERSYEIVNKYGYKQVVMYDKQGEFPICSQCKCMCMWNRGQGTMCDNCITEDIMECEHDFR